jgi:tetratricopeptide (TPR) repeat protein
LGEFKQALKYNKLALTSAQKISNPRCRKRREGNWLGSLGLIYREFGQFKQSIECHRRALDLVRDQGDRRSEGSNRGNLGLAYRSLGEIDQSIKYYEGALSIAREIGDCRRESIWLCSLGSVYYGKRELAQAVEFQKEALSIAVEINNPLGESYCRLGLARSLLGTGELQRSHRFCRIAYDLDVPQTRCLAALMLGIVLVFQRDRAAKEIFVDTSVCCEDRLDQTAGLYKPCYTMATALIGQAICDPRWEDESKRPELLASALEEYRRALDITAAPGVVQDAIRDLELIQAAGIEGLEPVFELLENAEYEPDVPEDLPDILEHIKSA